MAYFKNPGWAREKVLEMVEEGLLDKDQVILACLKYMSNEDCLYMAEANEFFQYDEDEESKEEEE